MERGQNFTSAQFTPFTLDKKKNDTNNYFTPVPSTCTRELQLSIKLSNSLGKTSTLHSQTKRDAETNFNNQFTFMSSDCIEDVQQHAHSHKSSRIMSIIINTIKKKDNNKQSFFPYTFFYSTEGVLRSNHPYNTPETK